MVDAKMYSVLQFKAWRDQCNMHIETGEIKKEILEGYGFSELMPVSVLYGMTYSKFINGLKKSQIDIDRKILADIAINQPETFKALVEKAQSAR